MTPFFIVLAVAVPVVLLFVLRKNEVIRFTSPTFLSAVSLILGAVGVPVALLCADNPTVMVGILITASILFGAGLIALAILRKTN